MHRPTILTSLDCIQLRRRRPLLVVNGDDNTMLPTIASSHIGATIARRAGQCLPDSGHGGIYQYHHVFVARALAILA